MRCSPPLHLRPGRGEVVHGYLGALGHVAGVLALLGERAVAVLAPELDLMGKVELRLWRKKFAIKFLPNFHICSIILIELMSMGK